MLVCIDPGMLCQESGDPFSLAVNETDPQKKLEKLEAYFIQYRRDPQAFNKNVFLHIVDLAMFLENYDKVIQYGERGLRRNWNRDIYKLNLYLNVARAYVIEGINLDKAYNYAEHVRDQSGDLEVKDADIDVSKQLYEPAVYIQLRILEERLGNPASIKEGLEKSLALYKQSGTPKAADYVFLFSRRYYHYFRDKDTAIGALDFLCNNGEPRQEHLKILALWYSKKQDKVRAVKYLKAAYAIKRDPGVGYSLGKLFQSDDPEQGMIYLSESFLLNDPEVSEKAEKLLLHLYFNVVAADKTPEEQEIGYDRLIREARIRLGLDDSSAPQ